MKVKRRQGSADDDAMANSDFEATWTPRIGEEATAELRHFRRVIVTTSLPALVLAGGASFAFAGGTLDKLLGVALLIAAMGYPVEFLRSQRKLAAALSDRFGVKITAGQIPPMSPRRFDTWCEKRGLHFPEDQPVSQTAPDAVGLTTPRS
jgi:hypothetical protein